MALAFVQSKPATDTGTTATIAVTMDAAPTQGNLLVAFVSQQGTLNTLTAAGSWNALTPQTGSGDSANLFWKVAGAGETAAQTVCTSSSSTRAWAVAIAEYSGTATSSPVDVENSQTAGSTPQTSPTVTPSSTAPVLLIGAAMSSINTTTHSSESFSGSNVGTVTERQDFGAGSAANGTSIALYDAFTTATTGSYSASATPSATGSGSAHIAIFKSQTSIVLPMTRHLPLVVR